MKLVRMLVGGTLVAALLPFGSVQAQGVTSAAVVGQVVEQGGTPIPGVSLTLTNLATGQRYATRTGDDGRYFFENVQVGGPYVLELRALGFRPGRSPEFRLTLGQRLVLDQTLERAAVELAEVTVTEAANPLINKARTGAQSFVSESALARLPTLGRNFTDFIQTVPQVVAAGVPGASIGGQNNRFNNIQIDGGVNNDLFGLAASGTPGGQADAHPISVEAVKEYQVLIAPFDVRQGSFTGGLVNAITKSGTNRFRGSAFAYLQNQDLVGEDLAGNPADEFHQTQYGLTFGGPLLRDRAHFFLTADIQDRAAPFIGQRIGSDTAGGQDSVGVGIRRATAERVRQILTSDPRYGFDPGGPEAPTMENPDRNAFAKLSLQLGTNSQLEVSHNYVKATDDNLIRNSTATGFRDGYQLSNSGYDFQSVTNTTRAKWTALLGGRFSNELILGYQTVRDKRALPNRVPLLLIGGDRGTSVTIAAGADRFSHANSLDQDIIEVTDNVTFAAGTHQITLGTHNEFFGFVNVFFPASLGVWSFTDTTALKNATPNRYEIALPLRPGGPTADFDVKQWGFYAQDRWTPTPRLTITAGLRVDVPSLPAPTRNPTLIDTLGINTGDFPSGNALWSPRVGFNYDVRGDGSTLVRGGIGVFSGRPPYVWVSNAYGNTGLEQATLICTGAQVPAFTIDPDNQPTTCASGTGAQAAASSIVYYDSDFRFPQALKIALGADHQLPWEIVGTFDFLYTKALNQFYISDVNLRGITGFSAGEAGRPLYGTLSPTSTSATPARRTAAFRDVLRHRNESADRSWSLTTQLQKRFSDNLEFNVAYTYSRVEDLISMTSSIAFSNYRFTALDGTIEDRNLRTSLFDIPHKITVSGTVSLPLGIKAGVMYIGQSGTPYTYMVQSDANADGVTGNDIVYVPRSRADISMDGNGDRASGFGTAAQQDSAYAILDAYINGEDCLRAHRGAILTRNSCRNPWISFLNARITKVFPTIRGQSIELSADVFNVLHLLHKDWGLIKTTADFEQLNLLTRTGYDTVNQRGVYALLLPQRERVTTARWRLQLGAKYVF
ncbi:MAG TPA: TonB-dependent receptor [Gemmatimonadales bacterium]|nr:TonB-dependent receptor [Gemmatimonadales bacterium]